MNINGKVIDKWRRIAENQGLARDYAGGFTRANFCNALTILPDEMSVPNDKIILSKSGMEIAWRWDGFYNVRDEIEKDNPDIVWTKLHVVSDNILNTYEMFILPPHEFVVLIENPIVAYCRFTY